MFQSVTAILAAVAVLWHSVAGCCAHHAHPHQPDAGHTDAVVVDQSHGDLRDNSSCCSHGTRVSPCEGVGYGADQCAPSSGGTGDYPCDGPSHCSESKCAFAVPDSSISLNPAAAGWPVDFLDDGLLRLASSARAHGLTYPFEHAPFLDCALRRHLALGVMLL